MTMPFPLKSSAAVMLTVTASIAAILAFSNLRSISAAEPALKYHSPAPDFVGIDKWLNSEPLSIKQLKGKVVLIDFWTASCINCLRTLPYVAKWYQRYKDDGFVVVGVHTPEFPFERETQVVQNAIQRFGIAYPVAQDNAFATWKAYENQYWPAQYLIDQKGTIVRQHFGEGGYEEMENAIRKLVDSDKWPRSKLSGIEDGK